MKVSLPADSNLLIVMPDGSVWDLEHRSRDNDVRLNPVNPANPILNGIIYHLPTLRPAPDEPPDQAALG